MESFLVSYFLLIFVITYFFPTILLSFFFFLLGLTIEEREELALLIAEEEMLDLKFEEDVHEDIDEDGILSQNDSLADSENFFETESSPIRIVESDEDVEKNNSVEDLNSNFFETLKVKNSEGEDTTSENCDTELRNDSKDKKIEIKNVIENEKSEKKISSVINDLITKIESEEETIKKIFSSPIVEVGTCYSPLLRKEEEINIQVNPLRNLLSSSKKTEKKK